jgi:GT2 family glycosyltransferase
VNATPRVVVVVLNWNRWQLTSECVESLQELTGPSPLVIVVDNGSSDGSVTALAARHPSLVVLESAHNLGFAGGVNVALEWLRREEYDYVWLLNNDAKPSPEALTALVTLAEAAPDLGAVGSVLLEDGRGAIQAWGGCVSFRSGLPCHHRGPVPTDELHYLIGASLLLRWRALRDVGFLDKRFFLYWEDTDLCFRLLQAGWRLAVAESSVVLHPGYGSLELQSPSWDREFTASSVLFFRCHASFPWWPILVSTGGRLLRRGLRGRWANARATWQGLRRGLIASAGVPRST